MSAGRGALCARGQTLGLTEMGVASGDKRQRIKGSERSSRDGLGKQARWSSVGCIDVQLSIACYTEVR
jgi:hypothetical protein